MLAKDVPGTLQQVKAWGFDEVETFGTFGAEIAPQLKAAGLKVRAMHIGYDRLREATWPASSGTPTRSARPRSSTPTCRTRRSPTRPARRS